MTKTDTRTARPSGEDLIAERNRLEFETRRTATLVEAALKPFALTLAREIVDRLRDAALFEAKLVDPRDRDVETRSPLPPMHNAIEKRTLVSDALEEQDKLVMGVHEAITLLEDRLHPVLEPEPAGTAGEAAGTSTPSRLLLRMQGHNRGLHAAIDRLRYLRARVEA